MPTPRKSARRHPLLGPRKVGVPAVWRPELVGKVAGYPKTEEKFIARQELMRQQVKLYNAEGITFRNGVKDGWGGKKKLINQINKAAQAEAEVIVTQLIEDKKFQPDNAEARSVLTEAMKIIIAEKLTPETQVVPLYGAKERLAAMKLVLEFVQKKPVSTQQVQVQKAEDFLAALAAE